MRKTVEFNNFLISNILFFGLILAFDSYANTPVQKRTQMNSEARLSIQENKRVIDEQINNTVFSGDEEVLEESLQEAPQLENSLGCLPIEGIYVDGITLLLNKELSSLTPIPESCIRSQDVNRLIREIMVMYVGKGYVTARVKLIQPRAYGELGLQVIEGTVESIEGASEQVNLDMLFPDVLGKPLNLRDLEQGIEQANRLVSNRVTVRLLPGNELGGSKIILDNTAVSPWHSSLSIDNYGQESTGRNLLRGFASVDSPLGFSDYLSISGASTFEQYDSRHSQSYSVLYSVPYGSTTVSGFGSGSRYANERPFSEQTVKFHGESSLIGLRVDNAFQRDVEQINTVSFQLNYKGAKNFINDIELDISSQRLAVAGISFSHFNTLPSGAVNANVGIDKGMSILGAGDATEAIEHEFIKWYANIVTSYSFPILGDYYQYRNSIVGQYSNDSLPGVEWIGISDFSAVRGFDKNSFSAAKGWYTRNTISRSFNLSNSSYTVRAGLDYGQTYQRGAEESITSDVIGVSIGQSLRYQKAILDIELNKGWVIDSYEHEKENILLLVKVSMGF